MVGGGGGGVLEGGWSVTTIFQLLMLSQNLLKSQSPITVRGGSVMTNFQTLILNLNLLKSQSDYSGGGVSDDQFPTCDAESKSATIPKSHYRGELVMTNFQLWILSPNLLKLWWRGGGGWLEGDNFPLLMLSPNLLKCQSPITVGVGGGW